MSLYVKYSEAVPCQITSPLPVPISITGCTYGGALPSGSTNYIQNTSTLQSGATFYVSSGTAATFVDQALSGNGTRCVQTDNTGLFSVASAACGSGGGGGSSSLQVTQSGVQITSPTASENFLGPPFIVTQVNTSTAQVTIDFSSITAQGNTHSLAQIAADTGTIEGQIGTLGASTGTIEGQVGTLGASTGTIETQIGTLGASTGTIETQIATLGVSTGALQSGLNNVATSTTSIGLSTAALQSGLNNVITSTAAIGVSTGALQSGLNNVNVSTTAIGVSTGVIAGIVNGKVAYSSFSATAPILYNSGTGAISLSGQVAQSETFTSSVTLGAAVLVSSNVVLSNGQGTAGQVFTSGVTGAPSWTTPAVGGGGSSSLAMTTGTSAGFATVASSPTGVALFNNAQFSVSLQGNATGFVSALTSSITAQGNAFNGASQLVQTNGSTQLPAISGALLTNLSGGNIVTGIPSTVLPSTIAYLSSTNTWTANQVFVTSVTVSTLVVTNMAVIPTYSQAFGRFTLNQWFSQMASIQVSSGITPSRLGKLSMFILGDSHFGTPFIATPWNLWMNDNFGNAGTLFPLSNADEQVNNAAGSWRSPGCTYTAQGDWIANHNSSTMLGFGNDQMQAITVGDTIYGSCPNTDQVTFFYEKMPNGGTVDFSVDGANHMTLPTAAGSISVASATISGLSYGVHTASVTYTVSGSANANLLDFIFFSTSTSGSVLYRTGTSAATTVTYDAMDATLYKNLLAMLPSTPSVVVVALGVNDAAAGVSTITYISNVRDLVSRFRAVYPNIDCAYLSEPNWRGDPQDTYPMVSYENALLAASVNDNCAFIDFTALFSSQQVYSNYYTDGIHLNRAGGQVAAQLMINAFSNALTNVTPFTVSNASSTVSYGTDISTAMFNNAAGIGLNVTYSTGLTNVAWLGNNAVIAKSNSVYLGPSGPNGMAVIASTVTASSMTVNSLGVLTGNQTVTLSGDATGSGATAITVTNAALQNNITTFGSSVTAAGVGGETVKFGVIAGSLAITNSTTANSLTISSVSTGIALIAVSSVVASNPNDFILTLASPTAATPTILGLTLSGHLVSSGTIPTAGACGTTPGIISGSTDLWGAISWVGAATTCVLNFATAHKTAPFCIGDAAGAAFVEDASPTTTSITFTLSTSLTASTVTWHCGDGGAGF